MRREWIRVAAAILIVTAAACEDPLTVDNRQLRPGILLHNGIPAGVDVPLAVDRNTTFYVAVATFGQACDEVGDTTVNIDGNDVEVIPQDWSVIPLPDQVCPDELLHFVHIAEISLAQPGAATVRIRGRREPGGQDITLVAQFTVR